MIQELEAIAAALREERKPPKVTTRTFLAWFGALRRGYNVVQYIRSELLEAGVVTVPDFEAAWIDGELEFLTASSGANSPDSGLNLESDRNEDGQKDNTTDPISYIRKDATYRIGKLPSANLRPVCVAPDDPLEKAITLMLEGDYSQLPVMTSQKVHGVLTWKSIASKAVLVDVPTTARAAMEVPGVEVRADSFLFDSIPIIVARGYVLVRSANEITGMVTASDLGIQFRDLTEPFLLLSEIENLIRNLIGGEFREEDLILVRKSKPGYQPDKEKDTAVGVSDLDFGDYVALLQNPVNWARLKLRLDRKVFCDKLDKVRSIRNAVMHFDTDGISIPHLTSLRSFASLLKDIEVITNARGGDT